MSYLLRRLVLGAFCLAAWVAAVPAIAQPVTGALTGTVTDAASRQPLPGVNVRVEGTSLGAATDADGRYQIAAVPVGTYALVFSAVGYLPRTVGDVVVRTGRATPTDAALQERIYESEGLVVEGGSYFEPSSQSLTSVQSMRYEEIRRAAGAVGDVLRLAQTMPGVITPSDTRNDLIVRGGSPNENLTLVDNVEVPNLNHYSAQNTSGGPISMLNTEFIDRAEFLSGGFSVQYGNRLSSALDIRFREGNRERVAVDLELGFAGFGALVEGPLTARGSFLVSARRSYLELLESAIGLTATPEYWNFNGKVAFDLNRTNKLWAVSLSGIDYIDFQVDEADTSDPSLQRTTADNWRTINGVNLQTLFSAKVYGVLGLSDAYYVNGSEVYDYQLEGAPLVFREQNREGFTTAKYDLTWLPTTRTTLRTGAAARFARARYDLDQPLGFQSPYREDPGFYNDLSVDVDVVRTTLGAYAEWGQAFGPRLQTTFGTRLDHFDAIAATRVSPRAAVRLRLRADLDLNASWGRFYQEPTLVFVEAVAANRALDPIQAEQTVVGLSYRLRPDLRLNVEGYVKTYRAYPVSLEYPTLSLANSGDAFGVGGLLIPLASAGTGVSRGVEVYLQKKLTERLYGQVSYSYAQTRHAALDGVRRPSNFDIPHTANVIAGYRLGPYEFSAKFAYAAGRPYTPFLEPASGEQNRPILDLGRINSERLAAYHRLDLRVDRRYNFRWGSLIGFMEILNVYNRENVQQVVWNAKTRRGDVLPQYSFLPSGGFNLQF